MITPVNQSPILPRDINSLVRALEPILREHGYTINEMAPKLIATANLPAAGAEMDGKFVLEDAGTNDVNLIVYSKGQRYRVDGGSPF